MQEGSIHDQLFTNIPSSPLPFSRVLFLGCFHPQQLELVLLCMRAFLWLLKTHFARGYREPHLPEGIQPLQHSP